MSIPGIRKNILATIAYYDGMNYPLTVFEIWKYLTAAENYELGIMNQGYPLSDVITELNNYNLKRFIEEYRGFYFLKGRKELVEKRIARNKISMAKIKRLRRIVWFLRFIPFVRMIGITGRLAMKNADIGSDWDVLVVLKSGKIWIGRTLITGFLHLIGKRRHGEKIKDRVCLNHFITDKSLEIITKEIECLFPANEFFFILLVFDAGVFREFQLKNKWIKNYKPNYYLREIGEIREIGGIGVIRKIGEKIFGWDFLEKWLRKWQSRKIMDNPKTHQPGNFVRISDDYLIFLPEPQGPELIERLNKKISELAF